MTDYLKDLAGRVTGAFAVGTLGALGADEIVSIIAVDWKTALGVGAMSAAVSLLKGVAAKFVGDPDNASLRRG